jgi:hypothetical protein
MRTVGELAQGHLISSKIWDIVPSLSQLNMIFLTSTNHGCVYTLSQEDGDELYYAPIYSNGNINLEEFAPVDMSEIDMDEMEVYNIMRRLKVMNEV